ncbi:unnamed protein product [Phytophthora fragariaefolia]|uniref:protein-tyrosine-phosphatase n=1 Tax=Phytophthora fragariaefolia TaxID=1490495 RepID=A0A9W6U6K7_9STRA|nr:unnamed protein product [Phytophthora fragariaefolia]
MPKEELPVVKLLLQRQSHHPLLEGFPKAARIGDLPLFLGEAGAAQDAAFLDANGIGAVIALGTDNLVEKPCDVLLIDILDMEEELLLPHFEECIEFLDQHLTRKDPPTVVLVHCVYGQSRSASICVAYLMATQRLTLLEAYDVVQRARPCISINPGFLRQLELFERMGNDPSITGVTPAHAELRTMAARRQRMKTGSPDVVATPQLTRPGNSLCCRKCNYVLATNRNQVDAIANASSLRHFSWFLAEFRHAHYEDFLHPNTDATIPEWARRLVASVPAISWLARPRRMLKLYWRWHEQVRDIIIYLADPPARFDVCASAAVNEQTIKQLILTSQSAFHLGVADIETLFPSVASDTVEQAFAVFDLKNSGAVDSCELFASLILLMPQLSQGAKQKGLCWSLLAQIATNRLP